MCVCAQLSQKDPIWLRAASMHRDTGVRGILLEVTTEQIQETQWGWR